MEKPHTGLDDCLRNLLSCFRARNPAWGPAAGWPTCDGTCCGTPPGLVGLPLWARTSGLESVQQSHVGSQCVFQHFNLQIEMQIWTQMRRTVIPHLKPILNTSKLKIELQIEMKWYTFPSVPTIAATCNTVQTAYKVYVCPRGSTLYADLLNNRPKVTL